MKQKLKKSADIDYDNRMDRVKFVKMSLEEAEKSPKVKSLLMTSLESLSSDMEQRSALIGSYAQKTAR